MMCPTIPPTHQLPCKLLTVSSSATHCSLVHKGEMFLSSQNKYDSSELEDKMSHLGSLGLEKSGRRWNSILSVVTETV